MNQTLEQGIRQPLSFRDFRKKNSALVPGVAIIEIAVLVVSLNLALVGATLLIKCLGVVVAGTAISLLSILGHDAAHFSATGNRRLNRALSYLTLLPGFHAPYLWRRQHNFHHQFAGQIGKDNAFPPLTPEQYARRSAIGRVYYRFRRSIIGHPFHYLLDTWLPHMILPLRAEDRPTNLAEALQVLILWGYMGSLVIVGGLVSLHGVDDISSWGPALANAFVFGFLLPFMVWMAFISFLAIVQHTSPHVRWMLPTGRSTTSEEAMEATVSFDFPGWLDWLTHRVMTHHVHHCDPNIPFCKLGKAQEHLIRSGVDCRTQRWTPVYHWKMARTCKLYDVERDCWTGFGEKDGGL